MFDLDQSITNWRRQMLAAGIKTPVPLEELEIHLREHIEQQIKSGINVQRAFEIAIQEIGPAHTVQNEFEKIEDSEKARKWREGQIWSGAVLGSLQLIVIGAVLFNSEMTFAQRISGLAAMATSFLLVAVARSSHRIFPAIRARRTRTAVVFISGIVPGIIWFWIFARFLVPGNDFGQYLTTLLWVSCPPLGAFWGLIWGIETDARRKMATAR